MHITLTQDEISVAVREYMNTNFPTLDIGSADIQINEDGEAEIAVASATKETPKTSAKRTTRKKVQAKKAEEPAENVVALKDEVAEDSPPFDVDPVEETKDEVVEEEATQIVNSKSLFA